MSVNRKCPKCGSEKVQLSSTKSKHGCLFLLLFGIFYVFWVADLGGEVGKGIEICGGL